MLSCKMMMGSELGEGYSDEYSLNWVMDIRMGGSMWVVEEEVGGVCLEVFMFE